MILLSFDIEEFDLPLEYKGSISFEQQIRISQKGLVSILDLLEKYQIKATFFSTVVFAMNSQDLIKRLIDEGHELGSHTWFHSRFEMGDLQKSRLKLETQFSTKVIGLRMPRMMPIDAMEVLKAGYKYNSSINPIFLPGRYNNFGISRTFFYENQLLQIPASVSPQFRIPLFWLSFHHFPLFLYRYLAKRTLRKDAYLNLYFHPWEFADIKANPFKLTAMVKRNSGQKMLERFEKLLIYFKTKNYEFARFQDFIENKPR